MPDVEHRAAQISPLDSPVDLAAGRGSFPCPVAPFTTFQEPWLAETFESP